MMTGLISVTFNEESQQMIPESQNNDSKLAELEAELEKCSEIVTAYKRIDCQKPIEKAIKLHNYQTNAEKFIIGPITYYWFGMNSEGNGFEISSTGQPILTIRMLAENTSSEIAALNCTSPQICAYDVWDGSKAFKYSGMDFTSGQIALNPNDSKEFNILFGPNIGYGGTTFEYDSEKDYHFRINESFGSSSIPLNLE
jgi:enamine deaminase RidA (YjgF/YER057c/UK114 family)